MSDKIKSLHGRHTPEVDQGIVEALEETLELAKQGIVQAAAIAYVRHDGYATTYIQTSNSRWALCGAVGHLNHRIHALIEENED